MKKLGHKSKNHISNFITFFFIWPLGAFLFAFYNFHLKNSRIIIYLYILLFGFTFVLGNDMLDSYRYAEYFHNMASYSFKDLRHILLSLFLTEQTLDIAQPLISFFVSRFTDDHRIFFGVISAIFGFFYLESINFLYQKHYYSHKNIISLIFILYFALIINPIFKINGFRFWTACWIFFYGTYLYIHTKNKSYLAIIPLSILFHFSFFAPIGIFFLYLNLGNKNNLYLIFLIGSFFLSELVFQLIPQAASIMGDGVMAKVGRYANLNTIEKIAAQADWAKDQGKWYLYLPGKLTFYYITFTFLYLGYKFQKTISEVSIKNTFSFSLLLLSFSNTVSFIPSMGRFRTLFLLFGVAVIVSILKNLNTSNLKWLFHIGLIPFALNLITVIRLGLDVTNPWILTFLPCPFLFNDISIYQWLLN